MNIKRIILLTSLLGSIALVASAAGIAAVYLQPGTASGRPRTGVTLYDNLSDSQMNARMAEIQARNGGNLK